MGMRSCEVALLTTRRGGTAEEWRLRLLGLSVSQTTPHEVGGHLKGDQELRNMGYEAKATAHAAHIPMGLIP